METLSSLNKNSATILAQAIKVLRKKQGFSQKDLSNAAGISQGQLSKIERGEHIPTIDNLDSIAKALRMPTSLITYLAFDRGKIEDEFSKKMFESYDILINFWFYIKKSEEVLKDLSIESKRTENQKQLQKLSKELEEFKERGMPAFNSDFIDEYLSKTKN